MSTTVDIDQVLRRIAALERELAQLRQQVASSLVQRELPGESASIMTCRVGGQQFGLLLDEVEEVVPVAQLLLLPEAEPWILGTLNLRGESVVVVDTTMRLLERNHLIQETEYIVVCRTEQRRVGLLVDEVLEIQTVVSAALQHPAPGVIFAPYLVGVLREPDRAVALIAAGKLAASSRINPETSPPAPAP